MTQTTRKEPPLITRQPASFWRLLYPNINTRIIVPYLLAVVVIAGIGVFIVTRLVAGSIQERFSNQLLSSASAASNSIVEIERQLLAALRFMVFTEDVPNALAAGDTAALDRLLRPIVANARLDSVVIFNQNQQGLLEIRWLADTGTFTVQAAPNLAGWNGVQSVIVADSDSLGDKFTDIIPGQADHMLYITAPVVSSGGSVVGGISAGLRLSRVIEQVRQQALSLVVFHQPDGQVLSSTFPVEAQLLMPEAVEAARLMNSVQNESPIRDLRVNGESYQILYAPLALRSKTVGLLGVALPSNYIVERASTSRDWFALIFVLMFATVGILGVLTGRSIVSPVRQLVATTRAIREGDLSRRVGLKRPDELGELGASFDHMTDELVRRNEQINRLYQRQVQETARLDAVLASISDIVIVQNLSQKIILQNRTAEAFLQHVRSSEALLKYLSPILQQPERLAQPRTVQIDQQHFSVLSRQVSLKTGQLLGHVIVFRDITALIEAERLKDEMILQMSHELRTPLATARGYTDLLQMMEQQLSEQSRNFVDQIIMSLTTLEHMVGQVIDVSTIISDRFIINMDKIDIAQIVQEQVEAWQPFMTERQLSLLSTIDLKSPWLPGDEARIRQLVDCLLQNAHNYTLPGGAVAVHLKEKTGFTVFTVVDTGVGIRAEEIDKVFDRMYRGSSADAGPTDARGLGLGLYIAKQIVEAHEGKITLESQPDVGTVVTVALPNQWMNGKTA